MASSSRKCLVGRVPYATVRVKEGMAGLAEGEVETVARGSQWRVSLRR